MLRLVRLVRPSSAPRLSTEDELLPLACAAAEAGDAKAIQTLVTVLGPQLLRIVRRVIGSRHPDVEDVAQECAMQLVRALPRFRRESSVKHFASRVALQTAMNARRRLHAVKRDDRDHQRLDADMTSAGEATPESALASRMGLALLFQLCEELPRVQSEVLALHYLLGHTVGEIAAICDVPNETVRSRLRLAKQALLGRALTNPNLRELLEGDA
jgi:RNA polymerase sigma factor (sigma-70 family)